MSKPNLFSLATKELSQDAIITWLLQWANPANSIHNLPLHTAGSALLKLFLSSAPHIHNKAIKNVDAGRQWENIDIWAEIEFDDNQKALLIIEDKIYAGEHSGQLERYKNTAQKWCEENSSQLVCVFLKIGSETQKVLKGIEAKGFIVYDRKSVLQCLKENLCNDSILIDFVDHLQVLDDAYQSFSVLPPSRWTGHSWVGFYQFVESRMEINMWHFVNNPSGGFWNLCLNWGYWNHFPVYMQIEQGRLCFKGAFSEDETGLDTQKNDVNAIQDFIHNNLLAFARANNFEYVRRPSNHVHKGAYRTE